MSLTYRYQIWLVLKVLTPATNRQITICVSMFVVLLFVAFKDVDFHAYKSAFADIAFVLLMLIVCLWRSSATTQHHKKTCENWFQHFKCGEELAQKANSRKSFESEMLLERHHRKRFNALLPGMFEDHTPCGLLAPDLVDGTRTY